MRTSEVDPALWCACQLSQEAFWSSLYGDDLLLAKSTNCSCQEDLDRQKKDLEEIDRVSWFGWVSVGCMICVVTICWRKEILATLAAELEYCEAASIINVHRSLLMSCPAAQEKARKAEANKQKQLEENERKRWNRLIWLFGQNLQVVSGQQKIEGYQISS